MNITFGPAHIRTLTKLNELAQKHNCFISFGTNDYTSDPTIRDFAEYYPDLTEEIMQDIEDNLDIERCYDKSSSYWFELYDKTNGKYNVLTYFEINMLITFDDSSYSYFNISDTTNQFISENEAWSNTLNVETNKQEIRGFKGVDTKDINVYREGMALKFFGDLVCDYLGEERIKEVY